MFGKTISESMFAAGTHVLICQVRGAHLLHLQGHVHRASAQLHHVPRHHVRRAPAAAAQGAGGKLETGCDEGYRHVRRAVSPLLTVKAVCMAVLN